MLLIQREGRQTIYKQVYFNIIDSKSFCKLYLQTWAVCVSSNHRETVSSLIFATHRKCY